MKKDSCNAHNTKTATFSFPPPRFSLFIKISRCPKGIRRSAAVAHLSMRLSGLCTHTGGTILITYYLTCNVFCPVFVCVPCFLHIPSSSSPSPPNKWKNIHCPGLPLNFSLSASNLRRAAVMSPERPNMGEEQGGSGGGDGNLRTSKGTLLNPIGKNPITLYECFSSKSLMQPSICFQRNTNEVLS